MILLCSQVHYREVNLQFKTLPVHSPHPQIMPQVTLSKLLIFQDRCGKINSALPVSKAQVKRERNDELTKKKTHTFLSCHFDE